MQKTAILLGATGVTGSILLQKLLQDPDYSSVLLFSRNSCNITHPKITEYCIDLLQLDKEADRFKADVVFCCIGTTLAKTPDKKLYEAIDYGIPTTAAKLCKQHKIPSFIVISSLGADPVSRFFYNRIKGKMEKEVSSYYIPKTYILRPSLISGIRTEKRLGESISKILFKFLNPFLLGSLKKYRSISPYSIATTMHWLASYDFHQKIIASDMIQAIAKK